MGRRGSLDGATALLLAALRADAKGIANAFEQAERLGVLDRVPEAAALHGVISGSYGALSQLPLGDSNHRRLRAQFLNAQGEVLALEGAFDAVLPVIASAAPRHLVFKGPALAYAYFDEPNTRDYTDVDVLVDRDEMSKVVEALVAAGATPDDPQWRRLLAQHRLGELLIWLPLGVALDLHWSLLTYPGPRRSFGLTTDDVFRRSRTQHLLGHETTVLSTTDTLIYTAVHACVSGGHRLRWIEDLHRLSATPDLDWFDVIESARTTRTALPLAVMLHRCARFRGTALPDGLLSELAPHSAWRSFLRLNDRLRPLHAHQISRATRHGTVSSLAAAPGLAWHDVVRPALRPPRQPAPQSS